MEKLWAGRFKSALDGAADDFNASIRVDARMYREDIEGSQAHVRMLGACGIVTEAEAERILRALGEIRAELDDGRLEIDPACEDIHSFVEKTLTARIGDTGKKLHTARSRNDQVAVDTRLYLRRMADEEKEALLRLVRTLVALAKAHTETILPGYTHLQRAQPISFAQQLLAYANMFLRDLERLADCRARINRCPLGAAALAGTTYPIDRALTARLLGFDGVCENSIDAVSDRDYVIELAFVNAMIAMHISRLAEEVTLWASYEFRFVELSDAFSTGSSIMPQKKNPDIAELARGKCGRVYGDLHTLLTLLKGFAGGQGGRVRQRRHDPRHARRARADAGDDDRPRRRHAQGGRRRLHQRHRLRRLSGEEGPALPRRVQGHRRARCLRHRRGKDARRASARRIPPFFAAFRRRRVRGAGYAHLYGAAEFAGRHRARARSRADQKD